MSFRLVRLRLEPAGCHTDGVIPAHELRRLEAAAPDAATLASLVERRKSGEPLQYLEGTAAFGPFELEVDPRVLIPRPETEQLWEISTTLCESPPKVIVDLCTGSGALAISLSHSFPSAEVHASDLSDDALAVAVRNGRRSGVSVAWHSGDLFDALPSHLEGTVDLFVANPPYVALHEFEALPVDVKHEPMVALVSGDTGLEILERICQNLADWLSVDGWFAVEIGETQGSQVLDLCAGFDAEVRRDLSGRDRFVVGHR